MKGVGNYYALMLGLYIPGTGGTKVMAYTHPPSYSIKKPTWMKMKSLLVNSNSPLKQCTMSSGLLYHSEPSMECYCKWPLSINLNVNNFS